MLKSKGILLFLLTAFSTFSNAQFYAPATEKHDSVQRLFVVETARALAWYENGKFPGLTEIKYEVTTKADGTTLWDIRWLDASGKPIYTTKVEYPASLLESGAEFYRTVSLAVTRPGLGRAFQPSKPADTLTNFWKGADSLGWSREETFQKALDLSAKFNDRVESAMPELAGLLTHAALFGVADRLTIDSMTAARGAAWLAFAERTTAQKLDQLWAPILFLGGREKAASELWQKTHAAALANAGPAEQAWNVWLRQPNSRDVYRFALEPGHLRIGMPMLIYNARICGTGSFLTDALFEALPEKVFTRIHNYGPALTAVSFAGGRMGEGALITSQRAEWIRLLAGFKGDTNDYTGYQTALKTAENYFAQRIDYSSKPDASLVGLAESAPLINLGRSQGVGPLIPVAVVTARDLLNYEWEMTGVQFSARHRFVNSTWGVPDLARAIYSGVMADIEGLQPFFLNEKQAAIATYREILSRLQLVNGMQLRVGWSDNFYAENGRANATTFARRAWLRPPDLEWQIRTLWDEGDFKTINDLLDYYDENTGALAASYILNYYNSLSAEALNSLTNVGPRINRFLDKVPFVSARLSFIQSRVAFRGKSNFEVAQALEQSYWKNPESRLEHRIFRNYSFAGANKSAQRFYRQARPFIQRLPPVEFSNFAFDAWLTAYVIGDQELRLAALKDSDSGSATEMTMHILEDITTDDFKKLKKDVDGLIERYGEEKTAAHPDRLLESFLPLIEALRDPKHPRHDDAIKHFAGSPGWPHFRFLCAQQFKLPPAEAIRFMGGKDSDPVRRALIAYIEKDLPGMLGFVNQASAANVSFSHLIFINQLYLKLKGKLPPHNETDLKPKEVESLHEIIAAKLTERRKGNALAED